MATTKSAAAQHFSFGSIKNLFEHCWECGRILFWVACTHKNTQPDKCNGAENSPAELKVIIESNQIYLTLRPMWIRCGTARHARKKRKGKSNTFLARRFSGEKTAQLFKLFVFPGAYDTAFNHNTHHRDKTGRTRESFSFFELDLMSN